MVVRERNTSGPRIKWRSRREGDSVLQTVTFTDCEPPVPDAINATARRLCYDTSAAPEQRTTRCAMYTYLTTR